jgi:hypothetical protein
MDVSSQEAQVSLGLIADTQAKWRRAIGAGHTSSLLVLWGLIWMGGFTSLYLSRNLGGWVFAGLDVVGLVATAPIARRWRRNVVLMGPETRVRLLSVWGLWLVLMLYAAIWLVLLRPADGRALGAFLCTVFMFGYIVIGLWFRNTFIMGLGLAVTALALAGFYLLSDYFYLWMALAGGGALVGTGLYIRRWR